MVAALGSVISLVNDGRGGAGGEIAIISALNNNQREQRASGIILSYLWRYLAAALQL